jgi:uncharacterized protein YjiS (DUF1127 family)
MQTIESIQSNVVRSNTSLGSLPKLLQQVAQWQERARGRYLLQQLDDRMLRDIGMSRSDVHRECAKYFWQR